MRFKDATINPAGVKPELLLGLMVCEAQYQSEGVELVITSLNDGRHSHSSRHYGGLAADLRSRTLKNPQATTKAIKERLPRHYDVIFEGDHIHIEYDGKRPL